MTKDELTNNLSEIEWEDFEVKEANSKQHPPSSGNLKNLTDDQPSDTVGKTSEKQLHTDDYGRLRTITDDQPSDTAGKPSENRRIPSDCNEQEKLVLEYIYNNGSIKSKDVGTLLNIKESRTRELLRTIVAKGYIEKQGKARNTFYTLIEKKRSPN